MSVTRIGAILQPALVRTASVVTDTSSTVIDRVQAFGGKTIKASEETADLLVALMSPAAVIALVLGLWRLTADLEWTGSFLISNGFFSHWQVWLVLAVALKMGASALAPFSARARANRENS
ncbi:MAG: hypothetical protein QOG67_339 [Verrucomicrobiota bacterium]|jgi:hypothetical protein